VMEVDNFEVLAVFFYATDLAVSSDHGTMFILRVVLCRLRGHFRVCGWNRLAWTLRTFSIFEMQALGVVSALFSARDNSFLLGLVVLGGLFGLPSLVI